jgi:opacity protein-like surface antigen
MTYGARLIASAKDQRDWAPARASGPGNPLLSCVAVIALGAALSTSAGRAFAADFPTWDVEPQRPVYYDWTGPYMGVDVGYQRLHAADTTASFGTSIATSATSNGVIAGAHFGYNWQFPLWTENATVVFGAEIDVSGATHSQSGTTTIGAENFNLSIANPVQSTLRGRFGTAVGPNGLALIYATAGVAFGRFESRATVTGPVNGVLDGTSNRAGWVAGVGVEGGLWRDWSWRLEYLHIDTGAITNITPSIGAGTILSTTQITEDILRTGISWHY